MSSSEDGRPVRGGAVGELVIRAPMPGMTRGFWRDPERYEETYWSRIPGMWLHGDWASIDADGFWFIHGRSDDTLKVAGKRVGPAEVESAAVSHPAVLEAAAIGIPHEIKGEVIVVLCVLHPGESDDADLRASVARTVAAQLGQAAQAGGRGHRRGAAQDPLRQGHAPGGAGRPGWAWTRVTSRRWTIRGRSRRSGRRLPRPWRRRASPDR